MGRSTGLFLGYLAMRFLHAWKPVLPMSEHDIWIVRDALTPMPQDTVEHRLRMQTARLSIFLSWGMKGQDCLSVSLPLLPLSLSLSAAKQLH